MLLVGVNDFTDRLRSLPMLDRVRDGEIHQVIVVVDPYVCNGFV